MHTYTHIYIYIYIKLNFQEVKRTDLAQDRDRWWALVSTVMNIRVP